MTVLKCANSGCASNSSAVSGGGKLSSRAPVSCVSIGPSAIRDTFLDFASQLLVGNTATNDLFHNITVQNLSASVKDRLLYRKLCSSRYRNRWNGSTLMYVPCKPRFKRPQKFSIVFV